MEIAHIKQQLSLAQILNHYELTPNKNKMVNCPFHEDKTASLQVNLEQNFYKCHACGKKGDQIQFVQDKENSTKREAILKCTQMVESSPLTPKGETPTLVSKLEVPPSEASPDSSEARGLFFQKIFETLQPKLAQSSKAIAYLKSRNLDCTQLEIGYNTGVAYDKLKSCLVFPLKNEQNEIVSLYGRSIVTPSPSGRAGVGTHFYTASREGLYPHYPSPQKDKLILTEAIIDCASLLQMATIRTNYEVLACFGTNGFLIEHIAGITQWVAHHGQENLEIIFFFDGDTPGNQAVQKHAQTLQKAFPNLAITQVQTPENEDINSLIVGHEPEILIHLLEKRTSLLAPERRTLNIEDNPTPILAPKSETPPSGVGGLLKIEVLGKIDTKDLSQLRVTIAVYNTQNESFPSRQNINLYNDDQVEKSIRKIAEKTGLGTIVLRKALHDLTEKLEKSRNENQDKNPNQTKNRHEVRTITQNEQEEALLQLKSPNLTQNLSQKLQQTGIIGEEKNALFLYCILLSHKMKRTLHAVVQGTSGSGKSHLITKIGDVMHDQNKIKRFTRVTDKSFYNYGEFDLKNTGIILEDYDGLSEEAEMAWRELQSSGKLSSSVSQKNEHTGEILTGEKYVFGPIASLVATTKFRIYEDNESRVFVIAIDESEAQTERVLEYMAKKSAKTITAEQEEKTQQEIQNMVFLLHPFQVQNPYRLELPKTVKHRRRLTQMLHDFIEQVTILYQYQRQKSNDNTLITEVLDLEIAVDLMFNSIVIKADELDGILRQFYENLKNHVAKKSPNYEFSQREIRQAFRISKTQAFRYFTELQELEYIHKTHIGSRNTYHFQISYWDNIEKLRQEIRQHLQAQIDQYKPK
jgi:DNA primase